MNPQQVNGEIFYHICVYPEWELELDKNYYTTNICRRYLQASGEKQKMEAEFEQYRINNTPLLPSRKNCFFVCNERDIDMWIKTLTKECRGYKIYEIELRGKVYWADASRLYETPEVYWTDDAPVEDMAMPEGLFVGLYTANKEISR